MQITERGDRTLYPSLLHWVDDDIDAQPLQFTFHDDFRYAAVLSNSRPSVPLHNFTQRQMQQGEVLIRHFGYNKSLRMKYVLKFAVRLKLSFMIC